MKTSHDFFYWNDHKSTQSKKSGRPSDRALLERSKTYFLSICSLGISVYLQDPSIPHINFSNILSKCKGIGLWLLARKYYFKNPTCNRCPNPPFSRKISPNKTSKNRHLRSYNYHFMHEKWSLMKIWACIFVIEYIKDKYVYLFGTCGPNVSRKQNDMYWYCWCWCWIVILRVFCTCGEKKSGQIWETLQFLAWIKWLYFHRLRWILQLFTLLSILLLLYMEGCIWLGRTTSSCIWARFHSVSYVRTNKYTGIFLSTRLNCSKRWSSNTMHFCVESNQSLRRI